MYRWAFLLLAACASDSTRAATPDSFPYELAGARSGQVITLSPGNYGALLIRNRSFKKPLVIRGGTFTSIRLNNVSGLILDRVTVRADYLPPQHETLIQVSKSSNVTVLNPVLSGPGDRGRGVQIRGSAQFKVQGATISKLLRGIVVMASSQGLVEKNEISEMRSDGINLVDSHHIVVRENRITDFTPVPGFHPDGIQMWSVKGNKPQSDILITRNLVNCTCQGITQFDHQQGGSDRIMITENDISSSYPHGIALTEARNAFVGGNRIRTLPGSRWRSKLNIKGGSVRQERNNIEDR